MQSLDVLTTRNHPFEMPFPVRNGRGAGIRTSCHVYHIKSCVVSQSLLGIIVVLDAGRVHFPSIVYKHRSGRLRSPTEDGKAITTVILEHYIMKDGGILCVMYSTDMLTVRKEKKIK